MERVGHKSSAPLASPGLRTAYAAFPREWRQFGALSYVVSYAIMGAGLNETMNVGNEPDAFEEVEHTADWALRVRGRDLRELLVNAARGMSRLLVSDLDAVPTDVERRFELDALDAEGLLVEWLSELAYWAEAEMLVFREFEIGGVAPDHLEALVRGGYASNLHKHIKAVTYHDLEIIKTKDGLEATVVFDV
jgi:SHS2 domain-containing protein